MPEMSNMQQVWQDKSVHREDFFLCFSHVVTEQEVHRIHV
jgi:hypothetical protein